MSFQRINSILQGGEIINYNLISEQLKSTLVEICNLLQEQNTQITSLQNELGKKAAITDIATAKQEMEQKIDQVNRDQQVINNQLDKDIEEVTKKLFDKFIEMDKKFEETKNNINEEIAAKEKDMQGDIFIANQQIREINVKIIGHAQSISKSQTEIAKINKALDSGKDKSLELLAVRVESCENKLNRFLSEHSNIQNSLQSQIEEISKIANGTKKELANELHFINVELKDVRHMVVDAPTFDVEGTIDTPSLIRAIQRDSRRIDNFNETINSVKNDHLQLNAMCVDLCKAFGELQVNLQDLVEQNNIQHQDMLRRCKENASHFIDVSHEVIRLSGNVRNTVDSTLSGFSQVSNDFLQLTSYISRLTNRNPPSIGGVDDSLLELQQQSDLITADNEKFEEKIKSEESEMTYGNNVLNDFKLPYVSVNVPQDLAVSDRKTSIYAPTVEEINATNQEVNSTANQEPESKPLVTVEKTNSNVSSTPQLDFEYRHSIQGLQVKLDNLSQQLDRYKEVTDAKIERKADTQVVERLLERNRSTINKLREKLTETMNTIGVCVKKDEVDKLLTQRVSTRTENDITISQPRSSLSVGSRAQETLPRLQRKGEQSHQIIYGLETKSQRSPSYHSGRY